MDAYSPMTMIGALGRHQSTPANQGARCGGGSQPDDFPEFVLEQVSEPAGETEVENPVVEEGPEGYSDDFEEDLNDPRCVQQIYDFSLTQIRGMVDYNDEDDLIQEVFYRLHKWPIGKKYNSRKHYFSLLKITIRQAIAAYWKRRHSQRNDARKRVFISQLQQDDHRTVEFPSVSNEVWRRLHLEDLVRQVMKKASTLSSEQKTMFQLRFQEHKSHEDIAQTLGVSIRTSYRIEARIRKILQIHFQGIELDDFSN